VVEFFAENKLRRGSLDEESTRPFTKQEVCVAKNLRDRKMRRARMQVFKPENYFPLREALLKAGAPT
jgi:alanine-alpha-ketoisovalerate/valine-pyruvate aminotransferase